MRDVFTLSVWTLPVRITEPAGSHAQTVELFNPSYEVIGTESTVMAAGRTNLTQQANSLKVNCNYINANQFTAHRYIDDGEHQCCYLP